MKKKVLNVIVGASCMLSTLTLAGCGGGPCPEGQHTYASDGVGQEATCTIDGYEKLLCTTCGSTDTTPIPATGHKVSADGTFSFNEKPTQTEGGVVYIYDCTGCHHDLPITVPSFSDTEFWTISTMPATILAKGKDVYECKYGRCEIENPQMTKLESETVGYFTYKVDGEDFVQGEYIPYLSVTISSEAPDEVTVPIEFRGYKVTKVICEDKVKILNIESPDIRNVICSGNTDITTLNLPEDSDESVWLTMEGCTSLNNIVIPEYIYNYNFAHCTSLSNITIHSTAKFTREAFRGCTALKKLELPEGFTSFDYSSNGGFSFADLSLDMLILPSTMEFKQNDDTNMASLIVSKKESGLHSESIFYNFKETKTIGNYQYLVNNDNKAYLYKYTGTDTSVVLPTTIEGNTVTGIYRGALENNSTIEYLEIPSTVTFIGYNALYNCTNLDTVCCLNKSITKENLFGAHAGSVTTHVKYNNISTATYTIPADVTNLTYKDLEGASCITTLNIPSTVDTIEAGALKDLVALEKISMPANVGVDLFGKLFGTASTGGITQRSIIGEQFGEAVAYAIPSSLNTIEIIRGTINIGYFNDVTCVEEVYIKTNVTQVNNSSFEGCTSLTTVIFDKDSKVTAIANGAFKNTAITKVVLGQSVAGVIANSFANNTGLKIYYHKVSGADLTVMSTTAQSPDDTVEKESAFTNATFYYYSETEATGAWYYNNNEATPWNA